MAAAKKALQDLDGLLADLDGGKKTIRTGSATLREKKTSALDEFDELEALVAQFNEETNKPRPPSTSKPPPPATSKPVKAETVQAAPAKSENCPGCNKPVSGTHIIVQGQMWHTECLKCDFCSSALGTDFFDNNGKRLCANCMTSKFTCAVCNKTFAGEYFIFEDKYYHPACMKNDTCAVCSKEIDATSKKVSALGKHYHEACFACTECKIKLSSTFFNKNDKPYCGDCAKKASVKGECAGCGKAIAEGAFISFESKTYHSSCFLCGTCKTSLEAQSFFMVDGVPSCKSCAGQS